MFKSKEKIREEIRQKARIDALEFVNYYKIVFSDISIEVDYVSYDSHKVYFELSIPSLDIYRDNMSVDGMKGYLSGLKYYATEIYKCKTEAKAKK